jgi:glycosyltransferase involved in cell wall biosynthesis
MHILTISSIENIGGASSSAWNLHASYQEHGHQSWLVVGTRQSDDPNVFEIPRRESIRPWNRFWAAMEKRHSALGLRVGASVLRELRQFWGWRNWLLYHRGRDLLHFPGTFRILSMIPETPDIIHCHNLHPHYFDFRYLPTLSRTAPLILNMRDSWIATGHCAYSLSCAKYLSGCGACPDLSIYPAIRRDGTAANWKMRRDIFRQCVVYLTAPSQWQLNVGLESGIPCALSKVIPNAIRMEHFCPGDRLEARARTGIPENAKVIMYFGHHAFKDTGYIEDALRAVRPVGGRPLLFVCIGRKDAGTVALGNGILKSAGYIKEESVLADFYRAADVYVHAAKGESFGKTVVEAMACGLPVVATNYAGPAEIVAPEKTGLLVSPANPDDMTRAIQRLLDAPELADAMGCSGTRKARSCYTLECQVQAFLAWYEEVREDWLARKSSAKPSA